MNRSAPPKRINRTLLAAAFAVFGASACDTSETAKDLGQPDMATTTPADLAVDASGLDLAENVCPPGMTYGGGETKTVAGAVTAKLVDETGAPVATGQPTFICGIDLCSPPGQVSANGSATIASGMAMKRPAFKFGDAIDYAEFAIPLTGTAVDFTQMGTGLIATAKLAGKPSAPLMQGKDATSGDVTLSLAANTTLDINTLIYDTPDKQAFRAVNIPLTNAAPVLPKSPNDFALLYGVSPAETTMCPPAQVTVVLPANLGWAPGTAVEFWIMTTDAAQTYAPYGEWAHTSEGSVSADGKTAVTSPGQGFKLLENFAVRRKP
jgi:hypothetical protein